MTKQKRHYLFGGMHCLLVSGALLSAGASAQAPAADALRAKFATLEPQLKQNQFKQPLVLDSAQSSSRLNGDIYAVVDYSFQQVNAGLRNPRHWCELMLLHINTKYCHAVAGRSGTVLKINLGKKTPESLSSSHRVDFDFNVAMSSPEYLDVVLYADGGPLGTRDYRIRLEAVALPGEKSFVHLSYSYATSMAGRLAMQTYLGTIGSGKVGFTITGRDADGQPDYIEGVRGVVERNTMRYYLAIDTFLAASHAGQVEKRLQKWFAATEAYPLQLREMEKDEYLQMKRAEHARQQTLQ